MSGPVLRVAWYRFRVTWRDRWTGYLTLVLLIGMVGGLAMAAIAGARRTQSSFPAFRASTNPSDVNVVAGFDPGEEHLSRTLSRLPHVKHVESVAVLTVLPLASNGKPLDNPGIAQVLAPGSVDGLVFNQDRVAVLHGRVADPTRSDEVMLTSDAARIFGRRAGDVLRVGVYTNEQSNSPSFDPARDAPRFRRDLKVVGIVVSSDAVVQDDIHRFPTYAYLTPAFTRLFRQCCSVASLFGVQLDDGNRGVATAETEIGRALPRGAAFYVQPTLPALAQAERAIKPEAIALGVFGGIAGLAAFLIAAQVIGRHLRFGSDELAVMRALGASPAMTMADGLLGAMGAVVIGSILAAAVAVGLSPLAPIGPVRAVAPSPAPTFDWTVLGFGLVVLIVGLSAVAVVLAIRQARRSARSRSQVSRRGSNLARMAATSGLPTPAVTGIRFALEPGGGRDAVPVRSAILGTALAMMIVIATLTFGASLHRLVSHPTLYGWNWNYEVETRASGGAIPAPQADALLARDRYVAAWTGVYFDSMQIDGHSVPVMGGVPRAPVGPPLLSGHTFNTSGQVVLGASTLAQLHKRVGDTVSVNYGSTPQTRTRLTIVGTATMPTVGPSVSAHPTMGTGALLSYSLIPNRNTDPNDQRFEPNVMFVRLRHGANARASLRSLQQIVATLSAGKDAGVSVVGAQRPAEIVNYRSMGTTPALLGLALAAGAVVALGLTLLASVRRRRRDLAILKMLGFTRGQLAAAVAWQSTVAVAIGCVVGVPLGVVVGRSLWDLFARELHVIPEPSVPALSVALVALGALMLANIVAAVPAHQASRTPTSMLLRAE